VYAVDQGSLCVDFKATDVYPGRDGMRRLPAGLVLASVSRRAVPQHSLRAATVGVGVAVTGSGAFGVDVADG
jgi:hypothetical protein